MCRKNRSENTLFLALVMLGAVAAAVTAVVFAIKNQQLIEEQLAQFGRKLQPIYSHSGLRGRVNRLSERMEDKAPQHFEVAVNWDEEENTGKPTEENKED